MAKTGALNFASLLTLEACATLCHAVRQHAGHAGVAAHAPVAEQLCDRARNISAELSPALWVESVGMFRPSTGLESNLTDVWGSAYAAWLDGERTILGANAWPDDVPAPTTPEQRTRIANFLADSKHGLFAAGQVRHLPVGQRWIQSWCVPAGALGNFSVPPCAKGTFNYNPGGYQNGGHWATPVHHVWPLLHSFPQTRTLACTLFRDFVSGVNLVPAGGSVMRNVNEWVDAAGVARGAPGYVASASNAAAAARLMAANGGCPSHMYEGVNLKMDDNVTTDLGEVASVSGKEKLAGRTPQPNVLLVMTDDLDLELGSEVVLPQTQRLLADGGARALNSFVSSPRCTPSRAAWLTGRHYHNLRMGDRLKVDGQSMFDPDAVFPTMRRAGYRTAIFGKIQNTQAGWLCLPGNHSEPFDHIETACHVCGDYYRPGPTDWVTKQTHGDPHVLGPCCAGPEAAFSNYSEAQYGNRSIRWIRWMNVAEPDTPWFAFIGTTGPHMSEIPAWWHRSAVVAMADKGVRAPRTPGFNAHAADKYGPLFATQPALDASALAIVDQQYRSRLGTLLSIDDMVAGLVSALEELRILTRTYVIFTSE